MDTVHPTTPVDRHDRRSQAKRAKAVAPQPERGYSTTAKHPGFVRFATILTLNVFGWGLLLLMASALAALFRG